MQVPKKGVEEGSPITSPFDTIWLNVMNLQNLSVTATKDPNSTTQVQLAMRLDEAIFQLPNHQNLHSQPQRKEIFAQHLPIRQ